MEKYVIDSLEKGIQHARDHSIFIWPEKFGEHPLSYIESGRGDRNACIGSLANMHAARSMYFWLTDKSLEEMKQEAYASSKLRYIQQYGSQFDFPLESNYFYFLISDHSALLNSLVDRQITRKETVKDINDPTNHLYRHYQMMLAVRGDWPNLGRRADRQLQLNPPGHKRFMVDQQFYLALAKGDVRQMENALADLTSPKMAKIRNDEMGFAFTHFFIGTHATMYAKIAWIHGYEVNVNTPLIPREWLPVKPLAKYIDPYDFMKKYSI